MEQFELFSRRRILLGGSAFLAAGSLSGCVPLFGIILRGGAVRAFAAGARIGGRASLLSLGRGVGIAGRSAKSAGVPLRSGTEPVRIISKDGKVLARSRQERQSNILIRNKQPMFRSNANSINPKDVGRLDHIDLNGNYVGRSVYEHSNRVDHFPAGRRHSNVRIGFDVIYRSARLIKHFDKNENEVGETSYLEAEGYTDIISDDETAKYFTSLNEKDARCPEVVAQRERYYDVFDRCSSGSGSACQRQNLERRRLRALEASCK